VERNSSHGLGEVDDREIAGVVTAGGAEVASVRPAVVDDATAEAR
jgi:hypothetical protein